MACGVYQILNLVTGKRYVGSSVDVEARRKAHFSKLRRGAHHSAKLQHSFRKHGEAAFSFSVLLLCSETDLLLYEQRALDVFDCVKAGYNILGQAGSNRGFRHSAEAKRKIAEASKRRPASSKTREALALGRKYTRTLEHRRAHSLKIAGRRVPLSVRARIAEKNKGKQNSLGYRHTDEARIKIREAALRMWAERRARQKQ